MTDHRIFARAACILRIIRGVLPFFLLVIVPAAVASAQNVPAVKPAHARPGAVKTDGVREDVGEGRAVTLTVTKARQFTMPKDVRDVVVADPAIADVLIKTPRLIYMIGNKVGYTNAIFLDVNGNQVAKLDVRVERDLAALRAAIASLVPEADVKVAPLNQDLVVSGDVPTARAADDVRGLARHFVEKDENLVNMMKVTGSQQVVIRIKVAEVKRTITKRLGFDLFVQDRGFSFGAGSATGNTFINRFGSATNVGSHDVSTLERWLLGPNGGSNALAAGTTAGGRGLSAASGFSRLMATIEALEEHGMVKTLAEPNLTALSGEPAKFVAGGKFPIPSGIDNNGNISFDYRDFGVSLSFTPIVLTNGRISLRISTEVSEIADELSQNVQGVVIRGLNTRSAQTTVEIPSGGSLMLGGLLRDDDRNATRGLPGLKDLPILGALFRSNDYVNSQSELVVIASPFIVRPATTAAMTAPTDGMVMPNDVDMYFKNALYARYGVGTKPENIRAGTSGPEKDVGYIMP
ncbi:MAG: type II and III secretion system protein family protein [Rhodospirillaceae bacterium]